MQHMDRAATYESLGVAYTALRDMQMWTWLIIVILSFFVGKFVFYLRSTPNLPKRNFLNRFVVYVVISISLLAYYDMIAIKAAREGAYTWDHAMRTCDELICRKHVF